MKAKTAIQAINAKGALLVFPEANKHEPPSLWYHFYPRTPMRWEWDESGDDRVAKLWHLREELARSGEVIYTKWFRGKATFFSKDLFMAIYHQLNSTSEEPLPLSRNALVMLEVLEMDSPISTKALKRATDLQGRYNEPAYTKALKELWQRLLIVGFGEIDDGAFPSLAIGATKTLFEDVVTQAQEMTEPEADEIISRTLPKDSSFLKFYLSTQKKVIAGKSSQTRPFQAV